MGYKLLATSAHIKTTEFTAVQKTFLRNRNKNLIPIHLEKHLKNKTKKKQKKEEKPLNMFFIVFLSGSDLFLRKNYVA